MKALKTLKSGLIALALSMAGSAAVIPAAQAATSDQFYMGAVSHLSDDDPGRADGKKMGQIALTELGATSLRDEAGWDVADPPGGVENYAAVADKFKVIPQNGGKMLLILDYSNPKYVQGGAFPDTTAEREAFLKHANKLIRQIGPQNLAGIEIWNEWDNYFGWIDPYPNHGFGDPCPDDPADLAGCPLMYAKLVEALLYPGRAGVNEPSLRDTAPNVPIIGNATSYQNDEWTAAVMTYLREHDVTIDGAVTHPYAGNDPYGTGPQLSVDSVVHVSDTIAQGYGRRLPIWVTEVGWSRLGDQPVGADDQARFLVEVYIKLRATGLVRGVWWYDLQDDLYTDEAGASMGLVSRGADGRSPGTFHPAGLAFSALAHFWAGCTSVNGSYQASNRTFQLPCNDGTRQIILAATAAELSQASAAGATLVDLLGQLPDVPAGGNVSALAGRPVGAIPATDIQTYTVSTNAGPNGTVDPATAQVATGQTQTFTLRPNTGYKVDSVSGCDGTWAGGNAYTTGPITAACTVAVTFAQAVDQRVYTVTVSAGAGGTITPSGPVSVPAGSPQRFTVTPNAGFRATVGGTCGGTLTGNTYTTNAITADCTVVATFTAVGGGYTITVRAIPNGTGTINPAGAVAVNPGATQAFTITPAANRSLYYVTGTCGGIYRGSTYTTRAANADCTVTAVFR